MGKISINDIIELAKEVESEDPIDWGMLNISEADAYKLIAMNVYEMYVKSKQEENFELVMLSTMTKLIVENFALNLKLHQKDN